MDCSIVINSIGLILDISGVLILFRYGLPSKIHTNPGLLIGDITEEQKEENKTIEKWAYVGLVMLLLGFIFQLISNFL